MDTRVTEPRSVSTPKFETNRSPRTGYKPELLVQYDKHDVAFTAWLASVDKIVYAGRQCYVLQFNLHFMNGLSERKRFRGVKFEVEAFSRSSSIEAPEMMFVRPASDPRLIQGMVLPPSVARWKICEPPRSHEGISRHVRLQAMVRCRGRCAIEVKDFQVKVGYKDWLRPDRVLQASHKGRSVSLLKSGISVDTEDSNTLDSTTTSTETSQGGYQTAPGAQCGVESMPTVSTPQSADREPMPESKPGSANPETSACFISKQHAGSDQRPHTADEIVSPSQSWPDSRRNFDKPEMVKLHALQEFLSARYGETSVALQSNSRASVINGQVSPSSMHATRHRNSKEMSIFVGELNSESDLLEAWLRRERLRKEAINTYLDTASWDASSRTRRRASPLDRSESGSRARPQLQNERVEDLEHSRKATVPSQIHTVLKKSQWERGPTGAAPPPATRAAPPPPANMPRTRMGESEMGRNQSEGEDLQRDWTTHDNVHEINTTTPKQESGGNRTPPKVAYPTNAERQWPPSLAWRRLSAAP